MAKKKFSAGLTFGLSLLSLIVGCAIGAGGAYAQANGLFDIKQSGDNTNHSHKSEKIEGVVYDDFQIHFMTLGNEYAGDSVYIKAGDNDILIDAGSRSGSASTTTSYMDNYVKDGKLEYVIATHGDKDHIDAFPKILEHYSAGVIIRNRNSNKTSATYNRMVTAFENQVSTNGAKMYYADQCFDNVEGASRSYVLSDKVTMDIIYNYYYSHTSSDENNYSVCTLFTYASSEGNKYFLLTGDLEKEGEEKLSAYYDGSTKEKTLPEVDLFKAGHHGSKTSSNDCLLNIIKPKMCVVSCCCGTDEYTGATENQFPTQQFIDRISKWTDEVYVTSIYESYEICTAKSDTDKKGVKAGGQYIHTTGRKDMNGNVVVSCGKDTTSNKISIGLACSNNTTKLKDSDWMNLKITIDGKEMYVRTMPESWKSTTA